MKVIQKITILIALVISIYLWNSSTAYAYTLATGNDGKDYKISNTGLYATFRSDSNIIYVRNRYRTQLPEIGNWTWQTTNTSIELPFRNNTYIFNGYQLVYGANNTPVELPNDCISTAQIIASLLNIPNISSLNVTDLNNEYRGFPEPSYIYDHQDTYPRIQGSLPQFVPQGRSYLSIPTNYDSSSDPGHFHVATVIATDTTERGTDSITLEATACPDNPSTYLSENNIIFDMYNEREEGQGFYCQEQVEEGQQTRSYVYNVGIARASEGEGNLADDFLEPLRNNTANVRKVLEEMGVSDR